MKSTNPASGGLVYAGPSQGMPQNSSSRQNPNSNSSPVIVTNVPKGTGYLPSSLPMSGRSSNSGPQSFASNSPGMLQPGGMIVPSQKPGDMAVLTQPRSFSRDSSSSPGYPNSAPNSAAYAAASRAASDTTSSSPLQYNQSIAPNAASFVPRGRNVHSNNGNYGMGMGEERSMTWVAFLFLVIVIVSVTITIAVVASKQSPDVSTHMIVRTGHRTRDWSTGNSYSMNSLDDNHYTRLYVCMKAAGIAVPTDPSIETFGEYKTAARSYHDCGPRSDRGWPRDIGFLRCIQQHFGVSFHQSNVFLKCLDLSEGASAESIQTPASMLFLGSYNFVTMLLTCMGIITAFLIFTAGGYFTSAEVHEIHGHISATHYWSPLSWIPTICALLWSFAMWVTVMIYAFPPSNLWSDAPSDSSTSLPGTPWTGFMCSVMVFGLFIFFISCLGEWIDDHAIKRGGYDKKFDPPIPDLVNTDNVASVPSDNSTMMPTVAPMTMPTVMPTIEPSNSSRGPTASRGFGSYPGTVGVAGQYSRGLSFQNLVRRSGYGRIPTRLGTKYNDDLYCPDSDIARMASPLNKTFALTWVFADGLMFIGMLNNQNSLLNENVVYIWYYIILCRGYQLTASFFMDDVLFVNVDSSQVSAGAQNYTDDNSKTESFSNGKNDIKKNIEIKAHAGIAVACSHLASLWCMIIVVYHFVNAISVTTNLSDIGVGNPTHLLQIFFIVFIILMEAFKHFIAFASIFDYVSQDWYLTFIQGIFSVDWIVRSVFIIATIFSVPHSLSVANSNLRNTILMSAT